MRAQRIGRVRKADAGPYPSLGNKSPGVTINENPVGGDQAAALPAAGCSSTAPLTNARAMQRE